MRKCLKWAVIAYSLNILFHVLFSIIAKIFSIYVPPDDILNNLNIKLFIEVLIIAPVLEELMFRGPIYFCARFEIKKETIFLLIFILGFIFGLAHITNLDPGTEGKIWYAVPRILSGVIYGWVTYRSKSLIPAILSHSWINLTAYLGASI